MAHIKDFIKHELTLCIAFIAAAVSCCLVPPDAAYLGYVDLRTLALLYCLMVVVAGLRRAGVFAWMAHKLCAGAGDLRTIGFTLVLLSFLSSMLITNDVALLTFVPFAVVVLGMAHQEKALIWVVVMQTAAANLGSMLTPVGNPQNIYLFSRYDFSLGSFLSVTLPIWVISLILISLLCLRLPKERFEVFLGEEPLLDRKSLTLYALLFLLCMCTVLRLLTWQIMLALVILVLLIFDRPRLLTADFWLLLTFVCFFVFSGNLARMDAVKALLQNLLRGRELLVGAAVSQVISNVPAALLLSGFTDNGRGLLLGVNIGGAGTLVASLASLITFREYTKHVKGQTGRFMGLFSAVSFGFLAILLAAMTLWMQAGQLLGSTAQ